MRPLTSIRPCRAVGLLDVAVVRAVVDVAVLLPDRLARVLVERDHVLIVKPVEGHDQQVADQDRRRAGSAEMVALQVGPRPQRLAGGGVDARSAGAAEVDIEPAGLDGRRAAGVAIERVADIAARAISKISRSCTTLPDSRSTHTAYSFDPLSVAVVIQIWSPQITGELQALPWIGVFQAMFSLSDQVTGRPVAVDMPSPEGPRNSGQFSPQPPAGAPTVAIASPSAVISRIPNSASSELARLCPVHSTCFRGRMKPPCRLVKLVVACHHGGYSKYVNTGGDALPWRRSSELIWAPPTPLSPISATTVRGSFPMSIANCSRRRSLAWTTTARCWSGAARRAGDGQTETLRIDLQALHGLRLDG